MDIENYYVRFGLEFDPFLKNAKDQFCQTRESKEVMTRLEYLQKVKGFGLLTGDSGVGKTTSVRKWCASMNPALYKVIYTSLSTVTVMEFYRLMAIELGAEPSYRKVENFRRIRSEIDRLALDKRITPVIIIDEADHMNGQILHDLKILFNFEMDSKDRAVVLMTGLPYMNTQLRLNTHEALRQRLVMNYNMESLGKEDCRNYLQKKLEGAGCTSRIFEEAAVEALISASGGILRVLNKLCSVCLLIGGSQSVAMIGAETVMQAVNDCQLG